MGSLSRRDVLKALAAAPLACALPAPAASEPRRLLVLVYLYGRNDAYNTWVPYADDLYYRVRPTIAVPRDSVIRITDRHGFHPSLKALVPAWEAKELALVQGIGYSEGTQQHFRDEETAFTGCDGRDYLPDGWITRALASRAPLGKLADAVALDVLDTRQADPMGPFRGDKLAVVQVYYASELLASHRFAGCDTESNTAGRARIAAQAQPFAAVPLKTSFGDDYFGQAMKAAVELAAADPTLPVIHVALNGLDLDKHHSVDCHWVQLKYHGDALRRLADGLAALRAGMIEIGRWDETLVATYDEFGRSPMENEDHGTHHGLATTHFVMGGRVKGGLYGKAPEVVRMFPYIGGPAPVIDTRALWTMVAKQWWNVPTDGLFPKRVAPLDLLRG